MPRPVRIIAFLLLATLPGIAQTPRPHAAEDPLSPQGVWALNLGKRTLLLLSLTTSPAPTEPFNGSLSGAHFQTHDGVFFTEVHGPATIEPVLASAWQGHTLALTIQDSINPSERDIFLLTVQDASHAQLQIKDAPVPPFHLLRAQPSATVATDWEQTRTYSPDDDSPDNPEMKRIFDEDQEPRSYGLNIDWFVVGPADARRREQTRKLLGQGALHTGRDYCWASFLFQHGEGPNDFLLAHTLAMIAVEKGYGPAIWIVSTTLDRYLQSIHQPQVYGTQFGQSRGKGFTQEPYDRTLISDALRVQLQVPVLSAQEQRLRQYKAEAAAHAVAPPQPRQSPAPIPSQVPSP